MQTRRAVSMPGQIVTFPGAEPLDCIILDLSLGGARISADHPLELPDELDLVFLQSGMVRRVKCRWRGEEQFGVQFMD